MPDIDVLRELTGQLRAPGFDDLVAVSRRRRRRAAAGAAAAVTVVALAVGGAVLAVPGGADAPEPAPQPPSVTPTVTPTVGGDARLERILARGDMMDQVSAPDGSLRAQYACTNCSGVDPIHHHPAIQVTEGDSTALFGARGFVSLTILDEHTVLAQDSAAEDEPVRYRLLRADGTEIALSMVADPAPAVPGPGVFVDRYARELIYWECCTFPGGGGRESLAVVDVEARTVRPVAAPDDVRFWGPNTDEALWGVTDDCRVRWAVDGTFRESDAGCWHSHAPTYIDPEWFPTGWLAPGRMVVGQPTPHGNVRLFVTLDGAETWQKYGHVDYDDGELTPLLKDIG
ncbi:hypothetical protein [Nocardioides taihuensis]|uniref:Uncharacterized protein n=1 Tax=Nocardioides taihuensis TaxID=1835606 RepID=A0ABW0BHD8_9ACTN